MRRPLRWLLLGALCALAGWSVYRYVAAAEARPLPWRDLTAEIGPVDFARPTQHRFQKPVFFARYLRRIELRPRPTPRVDFSREEAVLVAVGPRSSTGYRVVVLGVAEHGDRIVVSARERAPSLRDPGRARLTYPFFLIGLPRSPKPVVVDWQGGG